MDQNKNLNIYQVNISSLQDQVIKQNPELDFNVIEFIKFNCQLCGQSSDNKVQIDSKNPEVLHKCSKDNKTFYYFYCNTASQLLIGVDEKALIDKTNENKIAKSNLGNDSGNQSSDQKIQSCQPGANASSNNSPQKQNQIDSVQMGSQTAVENKVQKFPEQNAIKTIQQQNEKFNDSQQNMQIEEEVKQNHFSNSNHDYQQFNQQNSSNLNKQQIQDNQTGLAQKSHIQQRTQEHQNIAGQSSLLNPQHQDNQLQLQPHHPMQANQQKNAQYENQKQIQAQHASNQQSPQELQQQIQLQHQLKNSQLQQQQQQQLQSQHQQHSPQKQEQYHQQQQQQQENYQPQQDQQYQQQQQQQQLYQQQQNQNLQYQQQQQQIQQQQQHSQIAGQQQDIYKNGQQHLQQSDNQNLQQSLLQQQQQQGPHLQNLANIQQPFQPGGPQIASQIKNNQGQNIAIQQNIQQEPIKRVFVKGFEYVESQGQPVVQVQCGSCKSNGVSTVINLSRNEQNQKGENYKRVLCDKCKISIFFIFCECGEVVYSYKNKFQDPIIECSKQCDKINYIKCKGTGEDQKPCENQLAVSIKFPQIKGEFYSEVQCKKCETTNQYFFCKCLEIISNVKGKQKDFQYGRKIICPNADCNWKQYSLVRCPIDNCYQINIFTEGGNYEMGSIIQCLGCQNNFQQVTCPKCSDSLYFEGDYVFGKVIECPCHHKFQQVSCPYSDCYASVYRDIDTENQIQNGQSIICPECQREFYNHLCENCYENITLPSEDIRLQFHQARFYECNNCNNFQQIFECPEGHLNKTELSKQQYFQNDRDFLSFGERKCENNFCKDKPKLKFFLCPFSECQKVNRVQENQKTDKCSYCQKHLLTMKCKKCKSLNSYFQIQNEIQCITCKEQIKTDNNSEQKTICKICYTAQAEYIMDKCKHLVACSDCQAGLMQMGNGKCPLCRAYGKLEKIYL